MRNEKITLRFDLSFLLLINIILKLCNIINWSWWVVLWPLWADIIVVIIVMLFIFKRRK